MSLLDKLLDRAASEPGLHFRNPPLPHTCSIPGGLAVGSKVYIRGVVNANATRFSVNFQRGADTDSADIYFHFNPRLNEGVVVRNCRAGGDWGGDEEREGENPFVPSSPFLLVISAFLEGYEVEVDGKSFVTYKHRDNLPLANVTHLLIDGDVTLSAIHIPVANMPKKLRISVPGNVKCGDIFHIKGSVPAGATKFVVNLQCGPGMNDDIVFHFNPRFGDDNAVVRNSRSDEQWGQEERGGVMPFSDGAPFDLIIAAATEGFRTWINGEPFVSFDYRLDMSSACVLLIEDDVNVTNVLVDCAPSRWPPQWGDAVHNFKRASLQLYNTILPIAACIGSAMSPGKQVVVSGTVQKEPVCFNVNLQCDSCEEGDVAFHVNPRFEDQMVVLNSKIDSTWGEEICPADNMPFRPGSQFDLQILCKDDGYHLAVDGIKYAEFPHRMPCHRVNHVAVEGCVNVNRILVL